MMRNMRTTRYKMVMTRETTNQEMKMRETTTSTTEDGEEGDQGDEKQ
jgi:hypothetical protein